MFITQIVISHPTNVSAYDYQQAPADLRVQIEKYKAWAMLNGLQEITFERISPVTLVISYVWDSIEKRDALRTTFGKEYTDFLEAFSAFVTSRGCKLARKEESDQDVL